MSPARPLPQIDLEHVDTLVGETWNALRNSRVFLTGGTGFFGTWLVESLLFAVRRRGLNCRVLLLSRDPAGWASRLPHLATAPEIDLLAGDVRSFESPRVDCRWVIHAAYDSGRLAATHSAQSTFATIIGGTQRVLSAAREMECERLLFVSSGAVYGPQPHDLERVPETCKAGPDPLLPASVYGEAKRAAELLMAVDAVERNTSAVIARAFAFIGPHLPLDVHFAAGNFLADALAGRAIEVRGDGTSVRSYLYAADMAAWLWSLLLRGQSGRAYNVGSPEAVSVADLARRVACRVTPEPPVRIARQPMLGELPDRYIPDVRRIEAEFGLRPQIGLTSAIDRTLAWHASE